MFKLLGRREPSWSLTGRLGLYRHETMLYEALWHGGLYSSSRFSAFSRFVLFFKRLVLLLFKLFAGGIFISLLKKIKIHGVGVGAGVPEKVAGQSGLLAEGQGEYVKFHA